MNKTAVVAGLIGLAFSCIGIASAAPIIASVTASGPGLGSFSIAPITDRTLNIAKTFDHLGPITLTFLVEHDTGAGSPYEITESITNNSGRQFDDFHFSIIEPPQGNGVVFTSFNQSTLEGFALDSAPLSGPRNLNFTGTLADASAALAAFKLSPFDPGSGNTYSFQIVQTPSVVPEPGTWGVMIAGLLAMTHIVRRKV